MIAFVALLLAIAIAVTAIVTTTSNKNRHNIYPLRSSLYPLRVSANGRDLVDRSGRPYFMAADTAGSFSQPSPSSKPKSSSAS